MFQYNALYIQYAHHVKRESQHAFLLSPTAQHGGLRGETANASTLPR